MFIAIYIKMFVCWQFPSTYNVHFQINQFKGTLIYSTSEDGENQKCKWTWALKLRHLIPSYVIKRTRGQKYETNKSFVWESV